MVPTRPAAGARHHLGVLSSGEKNLKGTSFYLDSVKSRLAAVLVEAISNLGGVVEGFLNKDISCVVTGNQEWLKGRRAEATRGGSDGMKVEAVSSPHPTKWREEILSINNTGQRPSTTRPMVCGSRGKALLEKAMRNNDRLQGSSVLASARSWGVEIVHVDDFLTFVHQLKEVNSKVKHRRPEQRNASKCLTTRVVKAVALKSPYLKVEDSCRKYKPLYLQSMAFPTLYISGSRFSPFEPPPPPQLVKVNEPDQNRPRLSIKESSGTEHKPPSPLLRTPSRSFLPPARKKNLGYCECCHEPFKDQDEHLQSKQHRRFVQEGSHYSVVDQLLADMQPGFDPDPAPEPTATLMSVVSPQSLRPPNSPGFEHDTPSETEQAIQILLIQGSPSCILAESPTPVTRPASPSTATKPPDTGPPPSHPDTLCRQPHSPYSQPPPLSPQCMDPYYIVEAHSLYSEPPVLSPQLPFSETDVLLSEEAHLDHHTALLASYQPPTPLPSLGCVDPAFAVRGPDHDRLPIGHGCLTRGRALSSGSGGVCITRSSSLLQVSNTKHNPRKRCRSESPDCSATKRMRTSLIRGQRSDPSHSFSSNWTAPEATWSISSTHEPLIKASWNACGALVHKPIVDELYGNRSSAVSAHTQDNIDQGRSASSHQSVFSFGLANQNCPAVMGDKTANSLPREELGTAGPTFLLPCTTYFTQTPKQTGPSTVVNRNPSTETSKDQQKCPDASNTKCFSPKDKTLWPPSSQASHPSLSQSFSSVCIESALLPDMATPSSSDSEWDCGFVSRLGPAPASPLPSTGGRCGLDMEVLQRPCTWMHNTSYNSHLCSVLQPPISPPSLCGDESAPLTFIRTVMQSVVQH